LKTETKYVSETVSKYVRRIKHPETYFSDATLSSHFKFQDKIATQLLKLFLSIKKSMLPEKSPNPKNNLIAPYPIQKQSLILNGANNKLRMIAGIFNFSMVSGILMGIAFIVAIRFSEIKGRKSIAFLSLAVFFLTLNNLQTYLINSVFINADFFIRRLLIPFYLLVLPAFYAFLLHYLKIRKKPDGVILVSVLLFAMEVGFRIKFYFEFYDTDGQVITVYAQIEEIVNACCTLIIFVSLFVLLFNNSSLFYHRLVFGNIKWLRRVMFVAGFGLLSWFSAIILNLDRATGSQIFIYHALTVCGSLMLYAIGYMILLNYDAIAEKIQVTPAIEDDPAGITAAKAGKRRSHSADFFIIVNHIQQNRSYMNPSLSLEALAKEIRISPVRLSEQIRHHTNHSFSDFINKSRVEDAKAYLKDPEFMHYTIVAIGLECGFNSKSAFYTAFKKFTGKTPSGYRKEQRIIFS